MSLPGSAFRALVRRSDDARLDRLFGGERGLGLLLGRLAAAYDAAAVPGFTGAVGLDLRRASGAPCPWHIAVDGARAHARPGAATAAAVTVRAAVPDLVRMGAGELDPGSALLAGRLDLAGDAELARRLGPMFGRAGAL